jgi:hypothetical protein
MSETTVLESMPPERNAPRLTSAIIRLATAARRRSSSASVAASSDVEIGVRERRSATSRADQYASGSIAPGELSWVTVSAVPAGSWRACA